MTADRGVAGVVLKAAAFAAEKHRSQRRKDAAASPYINHPLAVASLVANEGGVQDPVVICAALLHDTLEDTETTWEELADEFGAKVADVVREVTDDKALAKAERKRLQVEHAAHASPGAKVVKLADKISNLRDIVGSPPADWSEERKAEYFGWARQVVEGIRGTNPRLESIFDSLYPADAHRVR